MKKIKMFCVSMNSGHLNFINEINYIPVGLGGDNYSKEWFRDNSGISISEKNKHYGEYTFHYWLWKNYIDSDELKDNWIGFCQYRKFWSLENKNLTPASLKELKTLILKEIPKSHEDAEVILGEEIVTTNFKIMKFLKKGLNIIIKNPSYIFNKNKRNIKFHFDLMHGAKNLDAAIELLDDENRDDFQKFVNTKTSFNPQNMFICKSREILKNYYSVIFPWLERCEKKFGFNNLSGYGKIRIYTFLAERFSSYWFKKNYKCKTMPIIFYDIRKDFDYKPL
tara:strand:- start:1210 stop:2049 length:840 start_codon:yes stop_codon:yes gene_type:complete